MEQTGNLAPENNNPNGFVNRVFNVSLDVENETSIVYIQETSPGPVEEPGETQDAPLQTPVKDRQEVSKRPRVTGGIWKILNRKRTTSELERRPHSMILPGETSIPKLSFADKVRSFKKLKSPSVFRGRTGKLSSAKFTSSLGDEDSFYHDIGTPQQPSRGTLRHRSKRHSYAGCTTEFDCSFEDIDLAVPVDGHQPTGVGEAVTQNGCKPAERVFYTKRNQNASTNCNKAATGCDESGVKYTSSTHQARGRRHKDVWSYLRRISLLGKSNPVYSERSFDSELHSLDKTMDSDYGSVDIENDRDCQPPLPPPPHKPSDTKGHFGGLFRFFNSVAETARKWRTTSHSFSPPEGEGTQLSSPRAQRHAMGNIHSVSLMVLNEGLPKPLRVPSSPVTTHSSACEKEDSKGTGGQSPTVVLKAFRPCSGLQAVNGLQSSNGTGDHIHLETHHSPTAAVENYIPLSCSNTENNDAAVKTDQLNCLDAEKTLKAQTGNDQDSKDAPPDSQQIQDVPVQSQQGDKESATHSVPASDSTEEIFKVCGFKGKGTARAEESETLGRLSVLCCRAILSCTSCLSCMLQTHSIAGLLHH